MEKQGTYMKPYLFVPLCRIFFFFGSMCVGSPHPPTPPPPNVSQPLIPAFSREAPAFGRRMHGSGLPSIKATLFLGPGTALGFPFFSSVSLSPLGFCNRCCFVSCVMALPSGWREKYTEEGKNPDPKIMTHLLRDCIFSKGCHDILLELCLWVSLPFKRYCNPRSCAPKQPWWDIFYTAFVTFWAMFVVFQSRLRWKDWHGATESSMLSSLNTGALRCCCYFQTEPT